MIMPLSTGLLAFFFDKNEQSKLMGYSSAMNNLGGIIATSLSGILVSFNWRYSFSIYIMGLFVMILVVSGSHIFHRITYVTPEFICFYNWFGTLFHYQKISNIHKICCIRDVFSGIFELKFYKQYSNSGIWINCSWCWFRYIGSPIKFPDPFYH